MSALRGRRVEGEVITGAQIKAARKLLGWTRAELAVRAFGVSSHTVEGAERARARIAPTDAQLASIQRALEAAGVEFTDGGEPGVGRATTFRYSCGRWAPFHPQGAQPDRSPSDKHQRWLEGLE